jgi:hypothetical protein
VPVGSGSAPVTQVTDAAIDAPPIDADPYAGYPPRLEAPASTCVLEGSWRAQPKSLALADGGKPFGEVFEIADARVTFGAGVYAEFTTATVRLSGFVDKSKVNVHAAAPFLVADVAAPGPKLPMTYVSTAGDQMTIELPLPRYAKAKTPLRATRACNLLSIDSETDFFPRDAIDIEEQSLGLTRTKRAIPVSAELGKPPVVTLTYANPAPVEVLETSGKHMRVVIGVSSLNPAEQVVFVGWVPSSTIENTTTGMGGSWATGGDRAAQRTPPTRDAKRVACQNETPLVVEHAGERRTVGVVRPKAVMEIVADADLAEIRFARPNVELVTGARWLVTRAALAGCAVAP